MPHDPQGDRECPLAGRRLASLPFLYKFEPEDCGQGVLSAIHAQGQALRWSSQVGASGIFECYSCREGGKSGWFTSFLGLSYVLG